MNKTAWLVVVIILALVGAVVFIWVNQPDRYRWYETLNADGDQPYDFDVFTGLLEANTYNGDLDIIKEPLDINSNLVQGASLYNYFIIQNYYFPDTLELEALTEFVRSGNTVFLSAKYVSPLLEIALEHGIDSVSTIYHQVSSINQYDVPDSVIQKYDEVTWAERDSVHDEYKRALEKKVSKRTFMDTAFQKEVVDIKLTTENQTSSLFMLRRKDTIDYRWRKVHLFEKAQPVAVMTDNTPFIANWKIGDGQVFLSSTPMLFSNIHMLRKEHFEFCNALISELPEYDILIDDAERLNFDSFRPKASLGKSPLSFILSKTSLRWAWYTLLLTAFLFILFRSKRLQRVIPIVKPNLNTTLAYAKMLGSLQLKEKNNKAKANEIVVHFMHHLRTRKRWHSNEVSAELKDSLMKLVPDLDKEVQITIHLATKTQKDQLLTDQEVVRLFNYSHKILQHI